MASIHIPVELGLNQFKASFAKVLSGLKELGSSGTTAIKSISSAFNSSKINEQTNAINNTSAAIMKQQALVDELKAKYEAMISGNISPKSLIESEKALQKIQIEIQKLDAEYEKLQKNNEELLATSIEVQGQQWFSPETKVELEKLGQQLIQNGEKTDELTQKAQILKSTIAEIKLHPESTSEAKILSSKLGVATAKLDEMKNKTSQTTSTIKGMLNSIASTMPKMMGKLGNTIKNAMSSVGKAIVGVGKETNSLSKGIERTMTRIKQLLVSVLVFNVLRSAFKEFRDYVGAALTANQQFANSFAQVKGNLMTAFQPILDVVVPILATFMSWLAMATAYLASFVSLLFGKSVKSSQAAAKGMNSLASSTKGTGTAAKKATKELEKQLATFDEINQLSKQSDDNPDNGAGGGSGGGAGVGGIAPVFTDIPDMSWMNEFVAKLKELTPDLEYFYNLGFMIGTKIIEGLQNIPWDAIRVWGVSFIQKLAALLNGVVGSGLIQQLGITLSEAINTALLFAYTWLTSFNWLNFGIALGQGLNNMVSTVNWVLLGATFASYIMSIFNTLYGVVTTFNWAELGSKIGTAINNFFANIDWAKLGVTVSTAIVGIFNSIGSFLKEVDWKNIGNSIGQFLGGIDWIEIMKSLFNDIALAISAALDVLNGISPVLIPILALIGALALVWKLYAIDQAIATATTGIWATATGLATAPTALFAAATTALGVAFNFLTGPIGLTVLAIAALIAIIVLMINHWDEVRGTIGSVCDFISKAFNDIVGWLKDLYNNFVQPIVSNMLDWLNKIWEENLKDIVNEVILFVNHVGEHLTWLWDTILKPIIDWLMSYVVPIVTTVVNTIVNVVMGIVNIVSGVIKTIMGVINGIIDFIIGIFTGDWERAWNGISKIFGSIWDGIVGTFKNIINIFIDLINGLLNTIEDAVNGITRGINKITNALGIPSIPELKIPNIPRLATGTVVPPNKEFMAILGDNKQEPEVVSPISTMKQAFTEALQEIGGIGNNKGSTTVVLEVDGQQLARVLLPHTERENSRIGVRMSDRLVTV